MRIFSKIFSLTFIAVTFFSFSVSIALAQSNLKPTSNYFGVDFSAGCITNDNGQCQIGWIGEYISAVYNYGVALAAVLAVVAIMVGGFIWLSSAGSPDKVKSGQNIISGALTGLVLALFSFVILQTVNPRLVALEPLGINQIENQALKYATEGGFCCNTDTGKDIPLEAGGCPDYHSLCTPSQECGCPGGFDTYTNKCKSKYACINLPTSNSLDVALNKLKSSTIFNKLNARVTSTNGGGHNSGSCHYVGMAADVAWDNMQNTSAKDLSDFCTAVFDAGFTNCRNEIDRGSEDTVWSGAHFHLAVCGCTTNNSSEVKCQ